MKRTALVTGASTGIGKAIALKLADSYDCIAITSFRHPEALTDTKAALTALGTECIAISGDSGCYEFVKEFVHHVISDWGHIDTLINNAGISHVGLMTDMHIEEWERILQTNLSSVFYYCHEVVPHMVHEHDGRILNISSVWGEVGASCEAAYSATKGGVNAFTKALGKELAPSGIAVNALSCGVIQTTMNSCFSEDELHALEDDIPYGRMATPDEVASFVCRILESPTYLTGQILRFDGGWI
jgi:3-oxoacyl-[acyl-carrier protein] reductase